MEQQAEEVINLFDSFWFQHEILKKNYTSPDPVNLESNPDHEIQIQTNPDHETQIQTNPQKFTHSRSISDYQLSLKSADFGFASPKLHTIPSGKELFSEQTEQKRDAVFREKTEQQKRRGTRKKMKRLSKSLSDLEFMELKGFMDLGFMFSEEDKLSNLGSIIPGLKKLGKMKNDDEKNENGDSESGISISRPYLSEAWEVFDDGEEKHQSLLMKNWRIPSLSNEICMKDNLKSWAHSVASTVR